ncbi:MAG: hypothetical protein PHY80_00875 [Rickettsiales bacterium]|nr:hypothetical protein [Rickettsiales bacterium]
MRPSKLNEHKKIGNKLVTPMNQIQGLTTFSWISDRVPEMSAAGRGL